MAAVSAVRIQGGFLFYGIVGNVKIAVFRNGELIPLGTGHTVDVLAQDKYVEGVLTREDAPSMLQEKRIYNYLGRDGFKGNPVLRQTDSFTGRGRGGNFQQWNA